jgi:hypothetical protein
MKYATGDEYEGWFDHNDMHGQGIYKYSNGDVFKGEFHRGFKHGKGMMYTHKNKKYFEGTWRDNEKNGEGTMHLAEGGEIYGMWKGDNILSNASKTGAKYECKSIERLYA